MEKTIANNGVVQQNRDPWIDNIRAVLVFLVVVGHFLITMTGHSAEMLWLRKFIYLFHMPAFLMLSGMLLKRKINQRRYSDGIKRYLVPYLICNFVMFFLFQFIGADNSGIAAQSEGLVFEPFLPYYSFWYLIVIFLYLAITPTLLKIGDTSPQSKYRPAVVFAAAVLCSVVIGLSKHYIKFLYLSPAIGFYPFFLMGYFLDPEKMRKFLKNKAVILISAVLWIGVIALSWNFSSQIDLTTFTMVRLAPAALAGQSILIRGGYRILVLVIGAVLSLMLFAVVPQKETVFSRIGRYSAYPYCIHTFILPYLFYSMDLSILDPFYSTTGYVIILSVCAVLTWLLTSEPVRKVFRPIVEPKVDWSFLFSKEED